MRQLQLVEKGNRANSGCSRLTTVNRILELDVVTISPQTEKNHLILHAQGISWLSEGGRGKTSSQPVGRGSARRK